MPRNGTIFGKEMHLVGKDDRIMAKSKIAVGKIALSKLRLLIPTLPLNLMKEIFLKKYRLVYFYFLFLSIHA